MLDRDHLNWLLSRCQLMRDTTKLSLDSQESSITAWTIVVRDYPDFVIQKLISILGSASYDIRFLRLKDLPGLSQSDYRFTVTVPSIRDDSRSYLQSINHSGYYIISRIDSDDEYSSSFSTVIRISSSVIISKGNIDRPWLLHTPIGCQVMYPDMLSHFTTWPNPAFVNMLMATDLLEQDLFSKIDTPYSFPHDNPPEGLGQSIIATHMPMWNMNIHQSNIQNSLFPWSSSFAN